MRTTLTIRNLDENVKRKLRVLAARHGRSMEAEVRDILAREVADPRTEIPASAEGTKGKFAHLTGIWKGRGTTDQMMKNLRGEA